MPVPGGTGATEWTGWRTLDELPHALNPNAASNAGSRAAGSSTALATQMIVEAVRAHPDRADTLLRLLASAASQPEPLTAQRAVIVDALAEALRERSLAPGSDVMFAHPLGITEAARRRFNIIVRAPAGVERFALVFNPADWDRSTADERAGAVRVARQPAFRGSREAVVQRPVVSARVQRAGDHVACGGDADAHAALDRFHSRVVPDLQVRGLCRPEGLHYIGVKTL